MRQNKSAQRCTHSNDTASRNANGDIDHVILTTFFDEMTSSTMPVDPKCEDPVSADGVPAENLLVHSNEWKDPRCITHVSANATQPSAIQSTVQQQALSSSSYSVGINQPVVAKRARFNDHHSSIVPSGWPGGMQTENSSDFSQPPADHSSSINSSTSDIQTQILEAILRLERKLDDVQRVQAQQQATINTLTQQNDRLLGYASTTQQALVRNAVAEAENMNMDLRPGHEKVCIPSSSIPGILTRFSAANVSTANGDSDLASHFDISSSSAASSCRPAASSHVTISESSNVFHCRRHSEDAASSSSPVSFHRPSSISSEADEVKPSRRPKYAKLYADLIRDPSDPKMGLVGGDPNIKMAAATYAQLFRKKGGLGAVRFLCSLLGQLYGQERLSRMSYGGKNGYAALKGEPTFNAAVAQTKRQFPGFEITAENRHRLSDKIAKLRVHLAKANAAGPEPLVVERAVDLDEHG